MQSNYTLGQYMITVTDLEIQKGGFSPGTQSASENVWVVMPTSGHVNAFKIKQLEVRTEYLEATLGLVKHLEEISKELIRECVTVPGCCCCMPLLHNHLMDSCSYVRKNTVLATKGRCICTPLNLPLIMHVCKQHQESASPTELRKGLPPSCL